MLTFLTPRRLQPSAARTGPLCDHVVDILGNREGERPTKIGDSHLIAINELAVVIDPSYPANCGGYCASLVKTAKLDGKLKADASPSMLSLSNASEEIAKALRIRQDAAFAALSMPIPFHGGQ